MNPAVQEALNEQIAHEFYASHLYLSMSAYCESLNLPGFARWLRLQSEEERTHALKIFDFLHDRGGTVQLQAIGAPAAEFSGVLDVFEKTLDHERKVTASINRIYDLALKERDYPTQVLMQWYINEQVEEEKNATQVIEQLKLVGAQGAALFILDRELGNRQVEDDAGREA